VNKPGDTLIYERVNNTTYARYANRPDIPRWPLPDHNTASVFDYADWRDIVKLTETNATFKRQFDKLLDLYYIIKSKDCG
jgi:hypothetical protein